VLSSVATAAALRGLPSSRAISPKISPGPRAYRHHIALVEDDAAAGGPTLNREADYLVDLVGTHRPEERARQQRVALHRGVDPGCPRHTGLRRCVSRLITVSGRCRISAIQLFHDAAEPRGR
jgi:hypothetical protein